eukprot:1155359-Pelagomonas_calceolata.AAC.2
MRDRKDVIAEGQEDFSSGVHDIILPGTLHDNVRMMAAASANTKKHGAPFRHMLFYGGCHGLISTLARALLPWAVPTGHHAWGIDLHMLSSMVRAMVSSAHWHILFYGACHGLISTLARALSHWAQCLGYQHVCTCSSMVGSSNHIAWFDSFVERLWSVGASIRKGGVCTRTKLLEPPPCCVSLLAFVSLWASVEGKGGIEAFEPLSEGCNVSIPPFAFMSPHKLKRKQLRAFAEALQQEH